MMKGARVLLVLVLALLLMPVTTPAALADTTWDGVIAVVWPHNGNGNATTVAASQAVNVSVWPRGQVSCTDAPTSLPLWMARDNEPADPVASGGVMTLRTSSTGVTFPSMEYNDIPANLAWYPRSQYRFFLMSAQTNIWVHAADSRTYLPSQFVPTGFSGDNPGDIDARIQIVWPHDVYGNQVPVSQASYVNIAVDLFQHGTRLSVPGGYNPPQGLVLWAAQGNAPVVQFSNPDRINYWANGVNYPRWVFNNVPVHAGLPYNFVVNAPGVTTHPTVWTHAQDARTYLPNPPIPVGCSGSAPSQPGQSVSFVREGFQNGQMIWRADSRTIYVLWNDSTWLSYPDQWVSGQPEYDPNLVPPAGLYQPVRGFGKVWRERLGGPSARLGWATETEHAADGSVQTGSVGTVLRFGSEVLILSPNGTWQRTTQG